MTVRAKFKLTKVELGGYERVVKFGPHSQKTEFVKTCSLFFEPAYSDDPNSENRKFWEATPSGELRMMTINADAASQFDVGRYYYLDFTPAEAA